MDIDFTANKHSNLAVSAIYLWRSVKHLWLAIADAFVWLHNRVIKRYPLLCMAIVIVVAIIVSLVNIGQARAERDQLTKQLYVMQQKIDSLEIIKQKR